MNSARFIAPRFSLVTTVGILVLCGLLMPVVAYYPFSDSPFANRQGFPLTYYTWSFCGSVASQWFLMNLFLDILFLFAFPMGCGILFERCVLGRLRKKRTDQPDERNWPIAEVTFIGLSACLFAVAGIVLPLLSYDRWCFAPAVGIWACCQLFGFLLGIVARRDVLGKLAIAAALTLTAVTVLFYLAHPQTFSEMWPERSDAWKARYEKAIDEQPEPLRSFLKATRPVSSDPDMLAYKNAVRKARESFSPRLTAQLIGLIDDNATLGYKAQDLLEDLYSGSYLVDGSQPYRIPASQLKETMRNLIDSLDQAKGPKALETFLLIFVKATGTEEAEVTVPFLNESIKVSYRNNTTSRSYSDGELWKSEIKKIIPIFQRYCQQKLDRIGTDAQQGGQPVQ